MKVNVFIILATIALFKSSIAGPTAVALGDSAPTASQNPDYNNFLNKLFQFFQYVEKTSGNCNNQSDYMGCSIFVKDNTSQNSLKVIEFDQPISAANCQLLCSQSNLSCVAYETRNLTSLVRNVTFAAVTGIPGQCNCTQSSSTSGSACPPENQVIATTTASTTTTPTTTHTTTPTQPTTTAVGASQVFFSVGSTTSYTQTGSNIPFKTVISNSYNHFDTSAGQFSPSVGGLMFVEACSGIQAGQPVNVQIKGSAPLTLGMTWNAKFQNGIETQCRSGLVQAQAGSSLSLFLDSGSSYSDANTLTGMTSFSLTSALSDDALSRVVYAVGKVMPPAVNNTLVPIPLVTVMAPTDPTQVFDAQSATYICKTTGPYFVSASVGVLPNMPTQVQITHPSDSVGLTRTSVYYDGVTSMSRNHIVSCTQGQAIQLNLVSGTVTNSDSTHLYNLTTFAVFPLIPRGTFTPVAFSLSKWYISFNNQVDKSVLDPFYFSNVTLNLGGGFDPNTDFFTAPNTGYYYFYLSCGAGVGKSGSSFTISLMRGTDVLVSLEHTSTSALATDLFGKSVIVQLTKGDQVRGVGAGNSYFYSSINALEVSWEGYQLQ